MTSLRWGVALLVFTAWPAVSAGQAQQAAPQVFGEYYVTRSQDAVCVPFARNLNQFRHLDFDVCHSRLSKKYPQLTRPKWEKIPFDLSLAETIFKNPQASPENAERWWQVWLKASASRRTEGKISLWRTRIDIDGDGQPETIIRLDNPLAPSTEQREQEWKLEENPCTFRHSMLYMFDSPSDSLKQAFNQSASALSDMIHFPYPKERARPDRRNGYYAISKLTLPADPKAELMGATRGMKVYMLFHHGAGEVCNIDWVPTGRYRPINPARPKG